MPGNNNKLILGITKWDLLWLMKHDIPRMKKSESM